MHCRLFNYINYTACIVQLVTDRTFSKTSIERRDTHYVFMLDSVVASVLTVHWCDVWLPGETAYPYSSLSVTTHDTLNLLWYLAIIMLYR